jgi:two-component system chemotaxis response regulator CheB
MSGTQTKAIVIGASAGALEALSVILPCLPEDYLAPIMVVVHVPPDKRSILADLFRARCRIDVVEVEDKEPLKASTIYFAPPDYHLLVETDMTLALSTEDPVLFSRPSIDVLFESAAEVFGSDLTAIILTGANQDGAQGVKAVGAVGGKVIVQDPESAFAAAMPLAALKAWPTATVMTLDAMAEHIRSIVR